MTCDPIRVKPDPPTFDYRNYVREADDGVLYLQIAGKDLALGFLGLDAGRFLEARYGVIQGVTKVQVERHNSVLNARTIQYVKDGAPVGSGVYLSFNRYGTPRVVRTRDGQLVGVVKVDGTNLSFVVGGDKDTPRLYEAVLPKANVEFIYFVRTK